MFRKAKFTAACAVLLMVATACGGGDEQEVAPTAEPTVAPTATPTAEPTEAEPTPRGFQLGDIDLSTYPLTGEVIEDPTTAERPALGVKMDNVVEALPQSGVADADILVEELVEGRLTRLVPVFHSVYPDQIGPVRSGRSSDPDILAAFNRPLFAWWGAMDVVKGEIAQAVQDGKLIDVGIDSYPGFYFRQDRPVAIEHTGYTNPNDLLAQVTDGEAPKPIFGWLDEDESVPDAVSRPAPGVSLEWGGVNGFFAWNDADKTWRHFEWGVEHVDDDGDPVAPVNVVILQTEYQPSAARPDSPQALTVGEGKAWVLTDGRVTVGTWEREAADGPWLLYDEEGDQIRLRRGQSYIALYDRRPRFLEAADADELLATIAAPTADAAAEDEGADEG